MRSQIRRSGETGVRSAIELGGSQTLWWQRFRPSRYYRHCWKAANGITVHFELPEHLEQLSWNGNPLEVLEVTVDFEYLRCKLVEACFSSSHGFGGDAIELQT